MLEIRSKPMHAYVYPVVALVVLLGLWWLAQVRWYL